MGAQLLVEVEEQRDEDISGRADKELPDPNKVNKCSLQGSHGHFGIGL